MGESHSEMVGSDNRNIPVSRTCLFIRGSMSANEGINKERRKQEIKETVDLTQKRDHENSHNDGK